MGESFGHSTMDFDSFAASPDSRWMGESVARRRQRRLSSPSLRTFLTPAFDAVAGMEGGGTGYSSSSSGGLDLGFDASLLRYRRSHIDATADLEGRILRFSPQSAPQPPPPPQARVAYPMADDGIWTSGANPYRKQHEVGGKFAATTVFHDSENMSFMSSLRQTSTDHPSPAQEVTNSIKVPAEVQEAAVEGTKVDLSTPKPEAKASSEQPGTTEEELDDPRIIQALYGHSGKRRLPIFMEICPE